MPPNLELASTRKNEDSYSLKNMQSDHINNKIRYEYILDRDGQIDRDRDGQIDNDRDGQINKQKQIVGQKKNRKIVGQIDSFKDRQVNR